MFVKSILLTATSIWVKKCSWFFVTNTDSAIKNKDCQKKIISVNTKYDKNNAKTIVIIYWLGCIYSRHSTSSVKWHPKVNDGQCEIQRRVIWMRICNWCYWSCKMMSIHTRTHSNRHVEMKIISSGKSKTHGGARVSQLAAKRGTCETQ